jgi:hypothetical protein
MPSYWKVATDYKRLERCRKLAAQSMVGFVCGESKFHEVLNRRAWKLYWSKP